MASARRLGFRARFLTVGPVLTTILALCLGLSSIATADTQDRWKEKLRGIDALLRQGEYARASKEADLSPYGRAAVLLEEAAGAAESLGRQPTRHPINGPIELPNCYRKSRAELPGSPELRGIDYEISIQVLMFEDGRFGQPTLVGEGNAPAQELAALEALRKWRCDPATAGGRPIRLFYGLSVPFQ